MNIGILAKTKKSGEIFARYIRHTLPSHDCNKTKFFIGQLKSPCALKGKTLHQLHFVETYSITPEWFEMLKNCYVPVILSAKGKIYIDGELQYEA